MDIPDFFSKDLSAAEFPNREADKPHDSKSRSSLCDLEDPATSPVVEGGHPLLRPENARISSVWHLFFFGDIFANAS